MYRFRLLINTFVVTFLAIVAAGQNEVIQYNKDGTPNDPGLARYVSRPDLRAPKWDFQIHHPELNSPGYWFVAPYRGINGEQSNESWVGPHIYDGSNGELIWSGGAFFHSNVEDFRVSNVNGESLLTLFASNHIVALNQDYTIRLTEAPETQGALNTHELNIVDNGTRAIFLKNDHRAATAEASRRIGFDGACVGSFDGFWELDVTTDGWPQVSNWTSYGRIGLEESTYIWQPIEDHCKGWDHLHANSVDKTPEGDYLFSGRHTNTIYKISGADGSILWRLGGAHSDFRTQDVTFSRQHNVRYRGRNETHFWISIMDNAKGQDTQAATHAFSRGLLLAIDEENMMVSLEAHYDHPRPNSLANRRGNYQLLPNDNVLMGWSERAMQSEYTPDGTLIWEALLQVDWMGSYRNYKFDFVGKPVEPPTAVSQSHGSPNAMTQVYVSWNGATEVASWEMYRTTLDGSARVLIASQDKVGFETVLSFNGYAQYIMVDALDKEGDRIGNTSVIHTIAQGSTSAKAMADGEQWSLDLAAGKIPATRHYDATTFAFGAGLVCGITLVIAFRGSRHCIGLWKHMSSRGAGYVPVLQQPNGVESMSQRAWSKLSVEGDFLA